jgi:hypothetical protein
LCDVCGRKIPNALIMNIHISGHSAEAIHIGYRKFCGWVPNKTVISLCRFGCDIRCNNCKKFLDSKSRTYYGSRIVGGGIANLVCANCHEGNCIKQDYQWAIYGPSKISPSNVTIATNYAFDIEAIGGCILSAPIEYPDAYYTSIYDPTNPRGETK